MPTTIVIGAGWAGLNCAYELAKAGHKIKIIEAAPQAGGRARAVPFQGFTIDNGQHVGIGAYHTLRSILKELGLQEHLKFKIMPLELIVHGTKKIHLKLPNIPGPYNFLAGVATAKNIDWQDKVRMIHFAWQIYTRNFCVPFECTVQQLLEHYNQSENLINHIWSPLTLAAMSTPITQACAQVFLNILQKTFTYKANHSHWFIPTVDLSNIFPNHITEYLQNTGNEIIYNQAIKNISIYDQSLAAYSKHNCWHADNIVLATHPIQTAKLLQPHPQLQDCYHKLTKLSYEPIITVYFLFAQPIHLPYPILGFLNTTGYWVFDREFAAQPNILSVVFTGHTQLLDDSRHGFCQKILQDIRRFFPQIPEPIKTKIICEKFAAFTCDIASQKIRPQTKTAVRNLWLSGDYVQTGLPATLEGALLSGKQTAIEILRGK